MRRDASYSRLAGRLLCSAALIVVVAGCSPGDDGADGGNGSSGNGQQPSASATPNDSLAPKASRPSRPSVATVQAGGAELEVNRAVSGDDGFTVVYWTLTNTGNSELSLSTFFRDVKVKYGNLAYFQDFYPWYLSETLLIEVVLPDEGDRYPPLTDTGSECLCGVWADDLSSLPAGESIQTYSAYYLPPGTESIAVDFPGTGKLAKDIPVQPMTSGG